MSDHLKFKLPIAPAAPVEEEPIAAPPKIDTSKFSELAQRDVPKQATRTLYRCGCGKTSFNEDDLCFMFGKTTEEVPA